ncbi:uncharacterized protein DS421_15g496980 [Arachis hypogaea]|nr:uncharacterized protein DS421_15g496980 [Arachis hypogaea]
MHIKEMAMKQTLPMIVWPPKFSLCCLTSYLLGFSLKRLCNGRPNFRGKYQVPHLARTTAMVFFTAHGLCYIIFWDNINQI